VAGDQKLNTLIPLFLTQFLL